MRDDPGTAAEERAERCDPGRKGTGDRHELPAKQGECMRLHDHGQWQSCCCPGQESPVHPRVHERRSRESSRSRSTGSGPFPLQVIILKELWIYSRYGIWRFFRIEDTGIVEICQDGTPLKNSFIVVARTVRAVYPRKTGAALVKE